nr:MAG: putative capsid protein [Arizlama virus]
MAPYLKRNLRKVRAPRRVRVKRRGVKNKKAPAQKAMRQLGTSIGRSLNPFPQMALKRHHYADVIQISAPTAGVAQKYTFRANGMYDPDYTGSGHQAMFRDDMTLHYKNYTVLNSSIRWNITPNSTEPSVWKAFTDDAASGTAQTLNELVEQRGMSSMCETHNSSGKFQVLKSSYSVDKWSKTSLKGVMADDTYCTAAGADPTNVVYFNIIRAPLANTQVLDHLYMVVQVTYLVLWRDTLIANSS